MKESMLQILREQNPDATLPTNGEVRLRFTNWMEEPGEAFPEVDDGKLVLAKHLLLKPGDLLLLEHGRVPLKDEITIQAYLWSPAPVGEDTAPSSTQDTPADVAEGDVTVEEDAADPQELATIMK